MRSSVIVFAIVCACATVIGMAAPQDQDDVRGAFLTSRPKDKPANSEAGARPSRRHPKPTTGNNPDTTTDKKPVKPGGPGTTSHKPSDTTKPVNVSRLGLGMTLFTRDSNGLAVRIDPAHVFRKGDRVRVLLETNTDGYLYIFNSTDNGPVMMIYPDADLDEAGNYMKAHVPWEIPSSASDQERLRWLVFDANPGTERLYFVLTREPLNGVPIEDELITLCRGTSGACPWHPSDELWASIRKHIQEPLATDKGGNYGPAQTELEQQSASRGISLAKNDPEPSTIMMASSTSPMLVATLELIHK